MMALQKRSFARQADGSFWATVAENTNDGDEMWQTVAESTKFDLEQGRDCRKTEAFTPILRVFGDRSVPEPIA
ncbi:hypothetical protein [Novosphingobium sp. NRRL B-2648]|uniref:hypothetical protein n=1 Tax=Novosphingobium TaxID=165696 RepID=UPI003516DA03